MKKGAKTLQKKRQVRKKKEDIKAEVNENVSVTQSSNSVNHTQLKPIVSENNTIEEYSVICRDMPSNVRIYKQHGSFVNHYDISIPAIGAHTKLVLEKIRQQLVKSVNLGVVDITKSGDEADQAQEAFKKTITTLINTYFPTSEPETKQLFVAYVLLRSIGLGELEILMSDSRLEEIAINGGGKKIWVYHRRHGWLQTNISIESDDQIKYFAATMGRKVGRQISILEPLLDVNLGVGDRVNATLSPISNEGNTITIRKFSADPWQLLIF